MERLRQYLEERDITQKSLAERMGVTQPAISGWLSGEYSPSIDNLRQLSRITGLSIDDLLDQPAQRAAS